MTGPPTHLQWRGCGMRALVHNITVYAYHASESGGDVCGIRWQHVLVSKCPPLKHHSPGSPPWHPSGCRPLWHWQCSDDPDQNLDSEFRSSSIKHHPTSRAGARATGYIAKVAFVRARFPWDLAHHLGDWPPRFRRHLPEVLNQSSVGPVRWNRTDVGFPDHLDRVMDETRGFVKPF